MLVGYARVSTQDQTLDLQKDALEKTGCTKLFTDTASGVNGGQIRGQQGGVISGQ
jgi:DNA invertase Pin-like site-specific DNA recombinase